jgi:hypothetical protein
MAGERLYAGEPTMEPTGPEVIDFKPKPIHQPCNHPDPRMSLTLEDMRCLLANPSGTSEQPIH